MGRKRVRGLQRAFAIAATAFSVAFATMSPVRADHVPEPNWFSEADPIAVTSSAGRVRDFERIGNRIFIGGAHTTLRDFISGPDLGPAYLGAIDRIGGQVITSFQPQLNGEVRAMARSADGSRLYVGGRFTTVNGEPWPNFVVLDPITGQRIGDVSVTGGGVDDVQVATDGTVYLAGAFHKINGVTRRRIGAFNGSTEATTAFKPPDPLNTVRSIALSPDESRDYYGGGYTDRITVEFRGFLFAADPDTGNKITSFAPDVEGAEVFDLAAHEDRICVAAGGLGGLAKAFRTDGSQRSRWRADGDVQVVTVAGNCVIFGGHYVDFFGSNSSKIITSFETGDLDYDGDVWFNIRGAQGAWAIVEDSQFLWIGGDINDARPRSVRGFARFTAKSADVSPPTRPGKLAVSTAGASELTISWAPSTDDTYLVDYDVYRDGSKWRTIGTPSVVDQSVQPDRRYEYHVIAIDRTNKQSAPSEVGSGWSALPVDTVIVGPDGGFRYFDTGAAAPSGWAEAGFDAGGWAWGRQILGFGEGDETTVVASGPPGNRHITTYFRRNFSIPKDSEVYALELDIEFDDGVVVYINGTEVARSNMPSGTVDVATRASSSVDKRKRSFDIDPTLLRIGKKNAIAIEVHQASPGSSDLRLKAELTSSIVKPVKLVKPKTNWRYDADGVGDSGWKNVGFDDSGWQLGRTPIGTTPGAKTTIKAAPTTVFFRRTFEGGDFDRYDGIWLKVRDNDGYIVRLNGIRIARVGLPAGSVRASTTATRDAPKHGYVTYVLPAGYVESGTNILTVEIHRFGGTGKMFFDASIRARP